jgi:hypothetical protein
VKKLYAVILVTFFIFTFASVGIASADSAAISATGQAFWGTTPSLGAVVNVTINFQSSSSLELSLYRIGIHTDWQSAGYYYSKDLSSDPQIVEANGLYSVTVPISIPVNATVGQHSLVISADGYTSEGDEFNWDSASQNFNVAVTAPTVSPTTNQNGNNGSSSPGLNDIIIYAAVIAVVVVVAILIAVLLMKRRSKAPAAPASTYTPEPDSSPPPEQAPSEQPQDSGSEDKPEGKDFNI